MSEKLDKTTQPESKVEITLESSLQAYFYDQLCEINEKYASPLPNEAIYYSSLVMDRFGDVGNYFEAGEDGKLKEKILGVKLLESTHLNKSTQKSTLKDVGDTALILCGYFADSLNKKIIDIGYYQDIGQIAYSRLDSIVPDAYEVPAFFQYLSSQFSLLTEVINLVSQKNRANGEEQDQAHILYIANQSRIKAS